MDDNRLYYEMPWELTALNTDFTGKWRPGDIFRLMQMVAGNHVDLLGFGFQTLRERNIAWILTRMELVMERYPRIEETVVLSTWPGATKHSVYPRYFEFRGTHGEYYGKAVSLWVLLDLESRSMLSEEKAQVDIIAESVHGAVLPFPASPRMLKEGTQRLFEKLPVYSDIDVNRHVNNTRYIDWLCDLFPVERFETQQIQRILINYAGEIHAGEQLKLYLTEKGNEFSVSDCPGGKSHFTIAGEWS